MKDINATIIVSLIPKLEDIKRKINLSARRGINKAVKSGLIVREANSEEDFSDFYELYEETFLCQGLPYDSIEKMKKRVSTLLVCILEGRLIAGFGIGFNNKYDIETPRMFYNSSHNDFLRLQPNNLLYWRAIEWAKKNSYKKLDLGGWQINAKENLIGINKFKERWGKIVYFDVEYPIYIAIGRKLVRNYSMFRFLNEMFKQKMKGGNEK